MPTGQELLASAEADPAAVSDDSIASAVRQIAPAEVPALLRSISLVLQDRPSRAESLLETLRPLIDAEEASVRFSAMRAVSMVAAASPGAVVAALESVWARLEDADPGVRAAAARTLVGVAEEHPDRVAPQLDRVVPLLADDVVFVRLAGMGVLESLLPDHAAEVGQVTGAIVSCLRSEPAFDPHVRRDWMDRHPMYQERREQQSTVRSDRELYLITAASLIHDLAVTRPRVFPEHLTDISQVLTSETLAPVRLHLIEAISAVCPATPEAADPAIEALTEMLTESNPARVNAAATWALAYIAEDRPDAVGAAGMAVLSDVQQLLTVDDDEVVGGSVALCSYLAEYDPAALAPCLERVRELLGHDDTTVRGMAVWVLGFAGHAGDVDRLEELAESDVDADVREAAAEASRLLRDRT